MHISNTRKTVVRQFYHQRCSRDLYIVCAAHAIHTIKIVLFEANIFQIEFSGGGKWRWNSLFPYCSESALFEHFQCVMVM